MKASIRSAKTAPFFIVLLVALVFGVDMLTPLGVADWLLYSVPLLLTLWALPYVRPLALATICTVLIILGFFLSPPGVVAHYVVLNRIFCIINLWVMAIIVHRRSRAEVAMVSQKQHLGDMIDSVQGIVWEADAETFGFTFVSPQAQRLLGYPASAWLEENNFFSRHLHPDDRQRVLKECADLVQANKRGELEYRLIAADGRTVWIRDMVNVNVGKGKPQLRGIMVDITEHKRAEEERQQHVWLLESMDKIDHAIQGTNDLEEMMGRVLDQVLSIFACDRAWLCYPCEPDSPTLQVPVERTRAEYPGVFLTGQPVLMDNECAELIKMVRAANGPLRFDPESKIGVPTAPREQFQVQSMMVMAIYPKLDKCYMFGLHQCSHPRVWTPQEERLFQDVGHRLADALTALLAYRNLRQTEDHFRSLTETIDEVFWMTDATKTKMLYVSPAYEKIWGRSVQSLYANPMSWAETVHPDDRERVRQALAKQANSNFDEEYRIEHPNGTVRWVRDQAFVVRDPSGKIERILGVARDVTDRRVLSEQLRQSQKMEAVGQLAGGVAHDFNNILTVIRGNADLALMELPAAASGTHDFLKQIISAADRAANLTGQLLMFGRRQVLQVRELDLNEVVTSVAKMLQRIIGEDVRLRLHLHPGAVFVNADAGMLDQVLMNLAVNARDAMPNGGTLMIETVECVVDEAMSRLIPDSVPGHYIRLGVSDTGEGIPKEILPRIFEPFFTTKEPGKGTGLGLATVFGIVKQHHGWIKVYSEPKRGTHFQIFLPASQRSTAKTNAETPVAPPLGGTETILLVEDDTAVRQLTRMTLEKCGYRVLSAENGPEAMNIWSEHANKIELLVTDVVMPHGMSGHALAQQLRQKRPNLKVIFTSGYSAEMAGKQLELASNEIFLQKPYPPSQLLREIRHSLDQMS